jgi:hypothetical protein
MFEGRDPTTGELLGRPHGRNAVPAFDVVLRPTKRLDPLRPRGSGHRSGGPSGPSRRAGRGSRLLDEHVGARRGHGGGQYVAGQGLLAVGFDHRTSRERDPLLHTHLVIANRVQGPDGRWTALDGRDLYRHRLAADAIYRASYQRELVRTLGVEWTAADGHGNRELQGVAEDLVRGFSKRTGQIDAEVDWLIRNGGERTPRLVKWAVHATRRPKQQETPDILYDRWRQEAAERGHDADTLVRTVTGRTLDHSLDWRASAEVAGRLFDQLAGPDGLTEHASTFSRPDVLVALGAAPGRSRTDRTRGLGGPVLGRAGGQRGRRPDTRGAPLVRPRPPGRRAAAGHRRDRPNRRTHRGRLPSGSTRCPSHSSHDRPRPAGDGPGPVPGRPAGGGDAGADQRGPARRLGPGAVAAGTGGRVGRLDPQPALAGGRHRWGGGRRRSSRQPGGAPVDSGPRRARGHGGRLEAAVPAQPGRRRLAAGSGGGATHRPRLGCAGAAGVGGCGMAAIRSPRPCGRCRSRPTRPPWS